MENKKRVRITIELPNRFVGLLKANITMNLKHFGDKEAMEEREEKELDPIHLVAKLVCMEACGAPESQIWAETPLMWRDEDASPILIHEERRVYLDGKLIGGGAK